MCFWLGGGDGSWVVVVCCFFSQVISKTSDQGGQKIIMRVLMITKYCY